MGSEPLRLMLVLATTYGAACVVRGEVGESVVRVRDGVLSILAG